MTFKVEIVLKGRDNATSEPVSIAYGEPRTWDDAAVRAVLVGMLRAIDRAENPHVTSERLVALRGFSWIVEPSGEGVVIAIEIPMGAAVAGPFDIGQAELDAMISRVMRSERPTSGVPTVH